MAKKGYIEVREGTPAYFKSVDPKQLIGRLRDEFLVFLSEALKELNWSSINKE